MAALLTSERANTDKMVLYIGECREMGIRVLPPDVNQSDMFFTVIEPGGASGAPPGPPARSAGVNPAPLAAVAGDIRFGLAAIKNVGEGAVEAVLAARRQGGPFASLFDFCERVDLRAVNRRVVESFIKSGSFDSLDPHRAALFAGIDRAMDSGQKLQ